MFKNYLTVTWRTFTKSKSYTFFNITGLSIGLCCVILISLFVSDELSYDRFHEDHEHIQAIARTSDYGRGEVTYLSNPFPLGSAMQSELPEVEAFVNTTYPYRGKVSRDGNRFSWEEKLIASSADFFTLFSFPLAKGDPASVLAEAGTVVITEELAAKYFPGEEPVGKTIILDRFDRLEYRITGVAKNPPTNSFLTFDAVFSIEGLSSTAYNRDSWRTSMYQTYVRFRDGTGWEDVEEEMGQLVKTHLGEESATRFDAVPIADLYLSGLVSAQGFKGDYGYMYIFSAIAVFILVLASINYMNLSTVRAMKRTLEVGIRKALGANKGDLIRQFLGESLLVSLIAFCLALLLVELTLPFFNAFFEKEIAFSLASQPMLFAGLFLLTLAVGLVSGSYPAFFLSRLRPSGVLKKQSINPGGVSFRKGLVAFQFCISSLLIICTMVVLNQLDYVQRKDLGFDKNEVLYIPLEEERYLEFSGALKQQLESYSDISAVSEATGIPGRFYFSNSKNYDPSNPEKEFSAYVIEADGRYADVLGLDILAGRFVDEKRASDVENGIVINEAMLREMEWTSPEEAVGKVLSDGRRVVGVIGDFHFQSLREDISPVIIEARAERDSPFSGGDLLAVRFNTERLNSLVSFVETGWQELSPEPLPLHFLNDELRNYYETEAKLGTAFSFFAGISIFIACMGLFGLVAFSAERRTKEIGIRKVLGAGVSQIVALLSRDFLVQVALGFAFAVPVAWYLMNQWLAAFAFRIEVGAGLFVISGAAAAAIALLTVGWRSARAALANPVESLRSE